LGEEKLAALSKDQAQRIAADDAGKEDAADRAHIAKLSSYCASLKQTHPSFRIISRPFGLFRRTK
jgi:hypothetical protein